ncbi:hypothetical protein [Qipengyuania spongiae]|uniref:Lipoprotein n=1 Tax=Qipengyuania spongiae TaxID=2909673 RepID=A0ABY5SWV8_9SPHN|nr:hypothetical protein [Qipengyuania spongiae]UVI39030.1 hypothetical protein L1F33_12440 [Qipengyuania spongiae]
MKLLRLMPAFGLAALTSACAVVPDALLDVGDPLPPGTPVGIDQAVRVGELVVTPKKVIEDSRCPETARCVWAGRLIVRTRIDGAGWRDTADITLGETYGAHGRVIALVSGLPEKSAEAETPAETYRFVYEAR